ncbi:MAG: hypothetical protein JRI68_25430 [Deltaproteobacteria bacterium]|nr:hypothetical protein [Deltaproteobacteria bacterium]
MIDRIPRGREQGDRRGRTEASDEPALAAFVKIVVARFQVEGEFEFQVEVEVAFGRSGQISEPADPAVYPTFSA